MNKLKKIMLVIIVTFMLFITYSYADTAEVNIEATRVREKKDVSSTILTVIYAGDNVQVLEDDGEWCKIKYKEFTGYVKKEFLKITKDTNSLTENTKNEVQNKVSNDDSEKDDKNTKPTTNENTENSTEENPVTVEPLAEDEIIILYNSDLKLMPSFMSKTISNVEQGKRFKIVDELNYWIKITDGTVEGWILESKVTDTLPESQVPNENNQPTNEIAENVVNNEIANNTVSNETVNEVANEKTITSNSKKNGKVNVETAKVREKASINSKNIGFLDYDDEVTIIEDDGEWYKIEFEGSFGYVNKSLVTLEKTTSRALTEERKEHKEIKEELKVVEEPSKVEDTTLSNNSNAEHSNTNDSSVVDFAKKYLGYPYVLGGKTPDTGFDCSGFTRYVYKNFGYNLASVAAEQNSVGDEVKREELLPGDLILFQNEEKTKIGHTGIYIGAGEFIHAANPKRGVVTDNLNTNTYYSERFVTARRIVK